MALSVSIVSPVFRGDPSTLRQFVARLGAVADAMPHDVEIVLVDDGGDCETTWAAMAEMARGDRRVRAVRLERNVRQTRAILGGVHVASGDVIVVMDSDLDDPPEVVPDLLALYESGHDLVVASRRRSAPSFGRTLASLAVNAFAKLLWLRVPDVGSSFLVMDRRIAEGVEREVERSGVQLALPTNFALSENPTTVVVDSGATSPSSYPIPALIRVGAEFAGRYAASRLAAVMAVVALASAGSAVRSTGRRRATLGGTAVVVGSAVPWLVWLPGRRRRDADLPLFEIAEVVDSAGAEL